VGWAGSEGSEGWAGSEGLEGLEERGIGGGADGDERVGGKGLGR